MVVSGLYRSSPFRMVSMCAGRSLHLSMAAGIVLGRDQNSALNSTAPKLWIVCDAWDWIEILLHEVRNLFGVSRKGKLFAVTCAAT